MSDKKFAEYTLESGGIRLCNGVEVLPDELNQTEAEEISDSLCEAHEARAKEERRKAVDEFRRRLVREIREKVPRAHTYASENSDVYQAHDAGRDAALRVVETLTTEP